MLYYRCRGLYNRSVGQSWQYDAGFELLYVTVALFSIFSLMRASKSERIYCTPSVIMMVKVPSTVLYNLLPFAQAG